VSDGDDLIAALTPVAEGPSQAWRPTRRGRQRRKHVSRSDPFDLMAMERATPHPLGMGAATMIPVATAEDSIVAKLEWFRLTNETSERQWDDVSKLVALLGDRLDVEHMQQMAVSIGVGDLLDKLLVGH
jgi:hypothetical protein